MVIIIVGVFSQFSHSRRLLLYWVHLQPKPFSPVVLSSRHLFSSANVMAESAPDVL